MLAADVRASQAERVTQEGAHCGDIPPAEGGSFKSPYVKLLNPSKNVRRLLEISGFELFFDIYTDLDTAIASF